jgi:hypothetical protein
MKQVVKMVIGRESQMIIEVGKQKQLKVAAKKEKNAA